MAGCRARTFDRTIIHSPVLCVPHLWLLQKVADVQDLDFVQRDRQKPSSVKPWGARPFSSTCSDSRVSGAQMRLDFDRALTDEQVQQAEARRNSCIRAGLPTHHLSIRGDLDVPLEMWDIPMRSEGIFRCAHLLNLRGSCSIPCVSAQAALSTSQCSMCMLSQPVSQWYSN